MSRAALPRHTRCCTRLVVVSRFDDSLQPVLVLWCPACGLAPTPSETDPPRAIHVSDVTPDVLVRHLRLLDLASTRVH